jgi:hypothetical protein
MSISERLRGLRAGWATRRAERRATAGERHLKRASARAHRNRLERMEDHHDKPGGPAGG